MDLNIESIKKNRIPVFENKPISYVYLALFLKESTSITYKEVFTFVRMLLSMKELSYPNAVCRTTATRLNESSDLIQIKEGNFLEGTYNETEFYLQKSVYFDLLLHRIKAEFSSEILDVALNEERNFALVEFLKTGTKPHTLMPLEQRRGA